MNRGVSQVITTVILTSILLTTIGVAIFYATSLINARQQQMEYSAARDTALYLADAVEQVALGTGGARMVKVSLSTVKIHFLNNSFGHITVNVGAHTILDENISGIIFQGGELVTTSFNLLRPSISDPVAAYNELRRFIVSSDEPLVIVYENFTKGAKTFVYSPRVRFEYKGVIARRIGNNFEYYNFFQINFIKIYFGEIGGSGTIHIVARNMRIQTWEITLPDNVVTVQCNFNGFSQSVSLSGDSAASGSVIIIRIAFVKISTR